MSRFRGPIRLVALLAAFAIVAALATGCADPTGTYQANGASVVEGFARRTGMNFPIPAFGQDKWSIEADLKKDKTLQFKLFMPIGGPVVQEGTWSLSGDKLALQFEGESKPVETTWDGDSITLQNEGQATFTLRRAQ